MSNAAIAPEERYAEIVEALRSNPDVTAPAGASTSKRQFGSRDELKANGKIFAFLSKGKLVVKLPSQRVDALIASGVGERYGPGHGRLMREWVAIAPMSGEAWPPLAREALEFVASKR